MVAMANGHVVDPEVLHKEGCTYGQLLAQQLEHTSSTLADGQRRQTEALEEVLKTNKEMAESINALRVEVAKQQVTTKGVTAIIATVVSAIFSIIGWVIGSQRG